MILLSLTPLRNARYNPTYCHRPMPKKRICEKCHEPVSRFGDFHVHTGEPVYISIVKFVELSQKLPPSYRFNLYDKSILYQDHPRPSVFEHESALKYYGFIVQIKYDETISKQPYVLIDPRNRYIFATKGQLLRQTPKPRPISSNHAYDRSTRTITIIRHIHNQNFFVLVTLYYSNTTTIPI